jgi:hypothetical protein
MPPDESGCLIEEAIPGGKLAQGAGKLGLESTLFHVAGW